MRKSRQSLEQIFEAQVQTLSLTLQLSTVRNYRSVFHRFLGYLRSAFPKVRQPAQLRRDPHMLGWIWPSKVISSAPVSLSAKIFPFVRSIFPGLCRRKMMSGFKRNCAAPIPCIPMLSC